MECQGEGGKEMSMRGPREGQARQREGTRTRETIETHRERGKEEAERAHHRVVSCVCKKTNCG